MTLYDLLNEGNAALQQAGDTDGENDAKLLLFEAFHLDLVHFLMDRLRPLSEQDAKVQEQIRTYREMIEKRASRIPLQQILGSQEFMGLEFYVNEHVLIPRQDTETLVELVLQEQQGREKKLLDLCTGSGCIAISLAVKGGYESVTATDLSEEALKVAERNAKTHQKKNHLPPGRPVFCSAPDRSRNLRHHHIQSALHSHGSHCHPGTGGAGARAYDGPGRHRRRPEILSADCPRSRNLVKAGRSHLSGNRV